MTGNSPDRVLIAGAGPVGLICAYRLARADIPVTVFEREDQLLDDPRAATTHPATLEMLAEIGIVEEVKERGLHCREFYFWDRPTGEIVAKFDHQLLADETEFPYVIQCEQFKLSQIVLARLQSLPQCEVIFSHDVTEVVQSADNVTIRGPAPDGPFEKTGRYLIGADGGRSVVRHAAEIEFEGFTYPERFVVFTTPFDFEAARGTTYRNYYADPDEWCNLFKVSADGPPGLWRTVFPTDINQSDEEVMSDQAVQDRLQKFFPKDGDYEIVHRNIYVAHQRVAHRFRKGRVFLAGDAAHVNNPIGGMGLNGGIHDAMNLTEKLTQVWRGEANDHALDVYDIQRRTTAVEFVQAQSIQNKKRLEASDGESRKKNLQELREISEDPVRAKKFMMGSSMLESVRRAATLG